MVKMTPLQTLIFVRLFYNAIKDPQWYVVQESDTTMLPIAASLAGQ